MPPDRSGAQRVPVARFISRVARRQWWQHFAICACAAPAMLLLLAMVAWLSGTPPMTPRGRGAVALLTVAAAMALSHRFRTRRAAAAAIERAAPSCLNVVITAEELERHPERFAAGVARRVPTHAAAAIADLRPGAVVPLHRIALPLAAALGLSLLSSQPGGQVTREAVDALTRAALPILASTPAVRVSIEPPSYANRPAVTLTDPVRIEALEGSRIRFEIADGWRVRFGTESITELSAREPGYFAVEPIGGGGEPLLIPLTVDRDRAPSVHITAPARDLLLPDASRTIPLELSASDDLGLRTLELRYTKVSGAGEHFEFVEGTLPAAIHRTSGLEWKADARLALPSLQLGPGDSLVYRAVARDLRPGDSGAAASDTYFVEIAGPGQVALEGTDMPPELDRYAMSQQMIVVKIEQLRRRQPALDARTLAEEASSIAAEQRTVRANFVFLLGGHVEDEEEEAAQSHEIQEGRLENTARKDINAAITYMTRAEQGLTALNTAAALPPARAAVESLQRAFGRSRYLLRSLAVRSRLDPSRRLTGDLKGAEPWRRAIAEATDRDGEKARDVLRVLIATVGDAKRTGSLDSVRLHALAESALKIDPSSAIWQEIAGKIAASKDPQSLEQVIAQVSQEALHGTISRTGLSTPRSAVERTFRMERKQ